MTASVLGRRSADRSLAALTARIAASVFRESPIGRVGLELEFHVIDVAAPNQRVPWPRLRELIRSADALPAGSAVSIEPGGQVELSTPPCASAVAAVRALQVDRESLGRAFETAGLTLAATGADPLRHPQRINPALRYRAMEAHFDALGHGVWGRAMMNSTAALQINLDAGPQSLWRERFARLHRLAPVLTAISACSPVLGHRSSGWASTRQQAWLGMDSRRTGAVAGSGDPSVSWARYALRAPVMLMRDGNTGWCVPVLRPVPFWSWWTGHTDLGRPPDDADLAYHLTTLFPPVRPRGHLELRTMDAVPDAWWPALATVTAILADDSEASDAVDAMLLASPVNSVRAARFALRDPQIATVAASAAEIAAARAPADLKEDVERLATLVASGRSPGDVAETWRPWRHTPCSSTWPRTRTATGVTQRRARGFRGNGCE